MPSKDANGNWVYSQAEYEHLNFTGEPFSGFVEGIGYTCTQLEISAYLFNRIGTEFMFNYNFVSHNFDMRNMYYGDDLAQSNSTTPDRSDYLTVPTFDKAGYRDDGWKYVQNPLAFVNNVATDIFNSVINIANSVVYFSQVGYHEGASAWWDYEWGGLKNQISGIGEWEYITIIHKHQLANNGKILKMI